MITNLWHDLPAIIRVPADFFILIIFLRGVVAKDITTWFEDHGIIRKGKKSIVYRALDFIYDNAVRVIKLLPNHERHSALWEHFKYSHNADVLQCTDGKCTTLSA